MLTKRSAGVVLLAAAGCAALARSPDLPPTRFEIRAPDLAQTPIVVGYFYNYLAATAKNVTGVYPTAVGHLFLYNAAKS